MRLFVSVDLDRLADAVADAQAHLPETKSLRPVDPAGAHVTLKFLGDVDPDRLDALEAALGAAVADAGVVPVEMTIGGFGVFPSLDYISVVWAGVRAGGEAPSLPAASDRPGSPGSRDAIQEPARASATAATAPPSNHRLPSTTPNHPSRPCSGPPTPRRSRGTLFVISS